MHVLHRPVEVTAEFRPWVDFSQRPLCGKLTNCDEVQNGGNGHF